MMRNKDKTKNALLPPHPHPPPTPAQHLSFIHNSFIFFCMSGTGNMGNGTLSLTVPLCCFFLLKLFRYSRVGSLRGLQPFRLKLNLLQRGFSMSISSCKDNLFQCGLSTGDSSFRKQPLCSGVVSPMGWSPSICSSVVLSMGFREVSPSPWSAGKSLFQCLEHLLPLLLLWL